MAKRSYILEGTIGSAEERRRVRIPIIIVRAGSFERAAEKLGGEATLYEGMAHAKFRPVPGSLGNLSAVIAKHAKNSGRKNATFSNSRVALKLLKEFTSFELVQLPVIK